MATLPFYGVCDLHGKWYIDNNGWVFHTGSLELAKAQAIALGSDYWVYLIGPDGKPKPVDDVPKLSPMIG